MTLSTPALRVAVEILKAFALLFSAVCLMTIQFLRNSLPAPHLVLASPGMIVGAIVLFQVVPALILLLVDRIIAWRYSDRALRRFRSALMIGALVIALRQLQLYWGPTARIAEEIQLVVPWLFPIVFVALSGLVVLLVIRFQAAVSTFFVYFGPAAVLLTLLMPFQQANANREYAQYDNREVATPSSDEPPVFVVVFDEFSYEALLGADGRIDAARYPNFGRLADKGLHLTNATTNHFYSWVMLPELIDAVLPLSEEYEVRFYEQAQRIERFFASGCGSEFTCRGARYLTTTQRGLSLDLGIRALYELLPGPIERVGRPLLHSLVRAAGAVPPPADPLGLHMISPEILSVFLSDITAEAAGGRVYFMHSLLPHHPFVFDSEGDFESDEYRRLDSLRADDSNADVVAERWRQYQNQVGYADHFIGELLARLEREGLMDTATLIVTADHGMRLNFPFQSNPIDVDSLATRVPMFIMAPNVAPAVSDVDYQHVDFGPTLYDVIGRGPAEPPPANTSLAVGRGVSALATRRSARDKTFLVYDYDNQPHYWRYVFDQQANEWRLVDEIDWLDGDRTLSSITSESSVLGGRPEKHDHPRRSSLTIPYWR